MDVRVRNTKHGQIYRSLRDEIFSGRYVEGDRLPSEVLLVQRFEASRPTISRALADLQRQGIVERRAGSGTYVRKNKSLPASNGVFGLLIPNLGETEIFGPICAAMAQVADESGYTLLWAGAGRKSATAYESAEAVCAQYVERGVAGVFFAPVELASEKDIVNHRIAAALDQAKIPVVLLDRDLETFPLRSKYDVIGIDNFAGGFMLAEHLVSQGCQRIRFVARPNSAATVQARISGFRELLVRRGLDHGAGCVCLGDPNDHAFIHDLIGTGSPDALVCANDVTAAQVMQGLAAHGVSVPRELKVVGFDDVKWATLLSVPLTTIHQPCEAIGSAAVRAMLERVQNPNLPGRAIELHAPLVVRESSVAQLQGIPVPSV